MANTADHVSFHCVECREKETSKGGKYIKCAVVYCSAIMHYSCSVFKPTELKFIENSKNVCWFCDKCLTDILRSGKEVLAVDDEPRGGDVCELVNGINKCIMEGFEKCFDMIQEQNQTISKLRSDISSIQWNQTTTAVENELNYGNLNLGNVPQEGRTRPATRSQVTGPCSSNADISSQDDNSRQDAATGGKGRNRDRHTTRVNTDVAVGTEKIKSKKINDTAVNESNGNSTEVIGTTSSKKGSNKQSQKLVNGQNSDKHRAMFTLSQVGSAVSEAVKHMNEKPTDAGKPKSPPPPVIGTNRNCKGVQAAARRGYVHVSRLQPNTTESDLVDHLKNVAPEITFSCELLKRGENSSSFKVVYPLECIEAVYDAGIWPEGVAVRRFRIPRRDFPMRASPSIGQ